jgi:hypothetical protein
MVHLTHQVLSPATQISKVGLFVKRLYVMDKWLAFMLHDWGGAPGVS